MGIRINLTGKKYNRLTIKVQANNKTNNHFLTFNGETLTINQWAEKLNIPRETIKSRLYKNKPIKLVLNNKEEENVSRKTN